jgi:hypothetical protein
MACLAAAVESASLNNVLLSHCRPSLRAVHLGAVSVVLQYDRGAVTCVLSVQMATPARGPVTSNVLRQSVVRTVDMFGGSSMAKLRFSAFCRSR